jgi:septal ring factor EnvC (AmiA/AmiB activator)
VIACSSLLCVAPRVLRAPSWQTTDFHRKQSENWQRSYREAAADLEEVRRYLAEVSAARDHHRQQSDAWQQECRTALAEVGAKVAERKQTVDTLENRYRIPASNADRP